LALAIMLVVVVGVLSLAVNAQGPFQGTGAGGPARSSRSGHPGTAPPPSPKPPRRAGRERSERRERQAASQPQPVSEPSPQVEQDPQFGDLKPLNTQAHALVMSVVDERTLGPVTRSRLTLRVQPPEGEAFEVTTRIAFPTPEDRAKVKVGGTIPVRYDSYDHRRVVVDTEPETGG
jgi:hypothetical protein